MGRGKGRGPTLSRSQGGAGRVRVGKPWGAEPGRARSQATFQHRPGAGLADQSLEARGRVRGVSSSGGVAWLRPLLSLRASGGALSSD